MFFITAFQLCQLMLRGLFEISDSAFGIIIIMLEAHLNLGFIVNPGSTLDYLKTFLLLDFGVDWCRMHAFYK